MQYNIMLYHVYYIILYHIILYIIFRLNLHLSAQNKNLVQSTLLFDSFCEKAEG